MDNTMNEKILPEQLVTENADFLLSFALKKIKDRELAKDLVQDTFLAAISNLDTFKGESSLRTWLASILNRKIIDHWRKAETRYSDPISYFFSSDEKAGHWIENKRPQGKIPDFEKEMDKLERYSELDECIEKLPEKWQGIITSKYFKEEKANEISKEFDVTSSNLWVIIHRSKLLLRECLEQKITD